MMGADGLLAAQLPDILREARRVSLSGKGGLITFSPKVSIALTNVRRDLAHDRTFAHGPRPNERFYLTPDKVLAIARAGADAGCHEALFTLGEKPELRYCSARDELGRRGHRTTIEYLAEMCGLVLEHTGLLPRVNAGALGWSDQQRLKPVTASQTAILETLSDRLRRPEMPHHCSPESRLETLRKAGELQIPFTTGILIGIGETRAERLEALRAIRRLHTRYGHIQEVIVQNLPAQRNTRMADHPALSTEDLLWTTAAARMVLGPDMNLQLPLNPAHEDFLSWLESGFNDLGAISPVTLDLMKPAWPHVERFRREASSRGLALAGRLPLYPEFVRDLDRWCSPQVATAVLRRSDGDGLARDDGFAAGRSTTIPKGDATVIALHRGQSEPNPSADVKAVLAKVRDEIELDEADIEALFRARGANLGAIFDAADKLRRETCGDLVSYIVTRNINYTNVCYFRCGFCAFSKGKLAENLRGRPYLVPLEEVVRRTREAWDRGAVEVCLQGGIHPHFDGDYYATLCAGIKREIKDIHIHAFSALEIWQGAATLGATLSNYLKRLRATGLASLPGTAAEILDDEVRACICPDKLTTSQWLLVHDTAHRIGLRSTATIMFGHVDNAANWARHLTVLRDQQKLTGGFTELVPLPFVHMEAPLYLKGQARPGPTLREAILMHAVARLALHPHIVNIQASWPKLGIAGAQLALQAGANDFGGTLMNESISRAAGASHGQEVLPQQIEAAVRAIGRAPRQRTTLYEMADPKRSRLSYEAPSLDTPVNPPVKTDHLNRPRTLVRPGTAGT